VKTVFTKHGWKGKPILSSKIVILLYKLVILFLPHWNFITSSFTRNWAPHHVGVLGEWRYSSTHSLTSALDGEHRTYDFIISYPFFYIPCKYRNDERRTITVNKLHLFCITNGLQVIYSDVHYDTTENRTQFGSDSHFRLITY
jgi:hypothetical protein